MCGVLLGIGSAGLGCPTCWVGVCVNPRDSEQPPWDGAAHLVGSSLVFCGEPNEGTWKVTAVQNFDYRNRQPESGIVPAYDPNPYSYSQAWELSLSYFPALCVKLFGEFRHHSRMIH